MSVDLAAAEAALAAIPARFPGPGGVAGLVHRGQVVARLAWGWADPALRRPLTSATPLPICSITKQFTCAALLDAVPDPASLDPLVREVLPNLQGPLPTVAQLAHNQSGLRDSWALTVLMGAQPEGRFTHADAAPLFARMRTTHFAPGSRYSYANGNFRILADLLERVSGRSIADHYARLFDRWGMDGARLAADTARPAGGVVGHEGSAGTVHVAAVNRIWWQGDAGIAASLDDMMAYERAVDGMFADSSSLYARMAAPLSYADGAPATYGWGLSRETVGGLAVTGHGGALRGFRSQRFHAAAERLSVFVALTHEASAHAAAASVIEAAAGWSAPPSGAPIPDGAWLDEDSGLLLTVAGGQALFGTAPEPLPSAFMRGHAVSGGLAVERLRENWRFTARPVQGEAAGDIAGRYACGETASTVEIAGTGGVFWAGFDGPLGRGPMEPLHPVGADLWALWTRRGMDAPAPGRWTVQVRRDPAGRPAGLRVGCWLARGLRFDRLD